MMKCENCGFDIQNGDEFCPSCGMEIYEKPPLQDKYVHKKTRKSGPRIGYMILLLILTLFIGFLAGAVVFSSNGQQIPEVHINQSDSPVDSSSKEFKNTHSGKSSTCTKCGGSGWLDCENCHKSGYVPCPQCNLSGVNKHTGEPCEYCINRLGIIKCPVCGGTGKIKCSRCNGKGKI